MSELKPGEYVGADGLRQRDWPRRWNGVRVERFDEVRDMWLDTGSEETVAFEQGRRYERERGHADE